MPPRFRSVALLLLGALCVGVVSGCAREREPEPVWQRLEVDAPSDRILWKVTNMSLNKRGFPRGELDLAGMEIKSSWRNDMAPFRGQGYRTRAHIKMQPLEPGRWSVEARVMKQINQAMTRQLSTQDADWKWVPDDAAAARILLQHVRSLLPDEITPTAPVDAIEELIEAAEAYGAKADA
ncbi:MAG: hypothetical protein WD226_00035 [Planctomycetota bacterium]